MFEQKLNNAAQSRPENARDTTLDRRESAALNETSPLNLDPKGLDDGFRKRNMERKERAKRSLETHEETLKNTSFAGLSLPPASAYIENLPKPAEQTLQLFAQRMTGFPNLEGIGADTAGRVQESLRSILRLGRGQSLASELSADTERLAQNGSSLSVSQSEPYRRLADTSKQFA